MTENQVSYSDEDQSEQTDVTKVSLCTFHSIFLFHCSIPYSSPAIRDARL